MPKIINSTKLRGEYNKIAAMAKETGEPIYITTNGESDTVIINQAAYEQFVDKVKIASSILKEERDRLNGVPGYAPEDVFADMRRVIDDKRD